ncbi:inosine-5'-monophosphate dehydrogenase [Candidatus Mycoplasma haematolamae str. Purdue]|uniref:Inosine-5'-monophosphate dehydrogenase n=1 Tax=Mycoplasma haematolamae (strain Purdue) TaxID=1212765 RepID=I7BJL2_MYCHA|nr:IMP dehydrogenase [Candidatus Mycoplasma haematolamae]AFO52053.1 inosine-5'-monophosphate dehydrogenase [Candidatus Mycoplasma haematolamae str. Purdue]
MELFIQLKNFLNRQQNLDSSLGFADVLILPGYSDCLPHEVSLDSKIGGEGIPLSLPFLSAAMDTVTEFEMARSMIKAGAIGVIHRNLSVEQIIVMVRRLRDEFKKKKVIYAAAIGVSTPKEDILKMIDAGVNFLVLDSAHGHSKNVGDKTKEIRRVAPDIFLVAGNVVTGEGARYLIDCGASAVKVGLGSGSICTTRLVTGVGYGEFSSIKEVSKVCKERGALTIADGGLNSSEEIVKALAAGADLVMLGYLFAGSDEAPGEVKEINGEKYKLYRGMGSRAAMESGSFDRYSKNQSDPSTWVPEGVESYVKYKGSVEKIILRLKSEIQTALGYIGAKNIQELQTKSKFVKITNSVSKKSRVHTVDNVLD